ncbi:MAG: type I glyceraldehyde-3-phosphate dehydrogenase [Erysipelotrichaceae bacterium]|nr:type I glyceraldehyde-3-phosphate dehydrogenase [Erysipelotrichaceae bacterium]
MSVKIAINGFGRIGRLAFRRAVETGDFEVVAINDLTNAANLAYLLKYDSAHGRFFPEDISVGADGDSIVFRGKEIKVYAEKDAANIDWAKHGVDIVLECTGFYTTTEKAKVHIEKGGAKGVIISAPAKDAVTPQFVYGVNDELLTKDMQIVSAASCTTNCLAPVLKVLHDEFGLVGGFMTTVHAYTNNQSILDLPGKDARRGRAAAQNLIPTTTGAAKAIGKVIPEIDGRITGGAIRVPVIDGSLVDLSLQLEKKVTVEDINAAMKKAAEGDLKDALAYTDEPIVSTDIIGTHNGSIYDATQTLVLDTEDGQLVKVVSWYDNEYGYTCQMLRLAKAMVDVRA